MRWISRWIFVRNAVNFAVNFCKKCGEMWWIIFFHRFHRISYINLPQKSMQWIFVRNAVKCGEFFFHRFHRISYINLPQKSMRWIFVRNAVKFAANFCKKCGEMCWNIYFHRIHRISYKDSPHSSHFLQKFTQKPRPG